MRHLPKIIESLFSNELSKHNWSKYTTPMVIDTITAKYRLQNPKSEVELNLLLKKLKPSLPIQETLVILTNEAYGELQG